MPQYTSTSHSIHTKNTDVSVDMDATIAQINAQKTSQPFGLKLQVFEEEQAVYIVEIANDKITNFCVGDQILQINGKKMSSVQDVMSSIGSSSIGDDIQFTVKRSQEVQVKSRKDALSCTLRKTKIMFLFNHLHMPTFREAKRKI